MGFAAPAQDAEVSDPHTGGALAVADAYWPDGLQPGLRKPVVLVLDRPDADVSRMTELGLEVFTSVDALRGYAASLLDPEPEPEPEPDAAPQPSETFDAAVLALIDRCMTELHYNPRYFRTMVSQHGALGAVRKILHAPAVSDGFVALWERHRLDLSVEALVLDDRFAHIFTEEERDIARNRLIDFGYAAPAA